MIDNTNDKIKLVQTKLNLEKEPTTRQNLNKKLQILMLRKQIEDLQKRIDQLSA